MGRTGSNWLAQELMKNEDLYVTLEKEPQFSLAGRIARFPEEIQKHYLKLVHAYEAERATAARRANGIHVDKSQASVWFAHLLADRFPDAGFVGIKRRVYSVVSSMLKREDMTNPRLALTTKSYRVPDRVDGITLSIWDRYPDLPIESRCALVWLSHMRKLDALQEELGDRLLVLQFEWMVLKSDQEFGRLWKFLGVEGHEVEADKAPLDKWMNHLTPEQVGNIWGIINDDFFKDEIDRLIRDDRAREW
jgi:hypothetical protein